MAKFDDQVAIMGDWMPPSPSPRTLFLSTMSDDVGLKGNTEANGENRSGALVMPEEQIVSKNVDEKERMQAEARVAVDQVIKAPEGRVPSRGGLLERVAARSGFNALRLNTEGMRSTDISQKTEARSPYLTISPGLSPTTLLDSPVFLSNSLVLPSPTTGKFQFVPSDNNRNSTLATEDPDKRKDNYFEDINNSSFAFKPVVESSHHIFSIEQSQAISFTLAQQSFPTNEFSIQSENFILPQNIPTKLASQTGTALKFQADLSRCSSEKDSGANNISSEPKVFDTVGDSEHSLPLDDQKEDDVDQRGGGDTNLGGAPSEDGYNWRKYGQKQVKGSEYPRSYYKCTYPNCPVKKKVERSHEGHVTEIIYKGTHCHHKPPPKRRSALGSSNVLTDMQLDVSEQDGTGAEGNLFWTTMQKVTATGVPDWRQENLGGTFSAALDTEYCNASASLQAQTGAQFEAGDALDESSAFSNDEDEEDRRTHGSVSLGYDGEDYESESKRRKIDAYTTEMSGATRAIREPRVVVQTTSEVDILDDGFRWRKYGQKVVKGNPNPRSYYKCTSAGCSVRKHVERASHDLKSVITTYEGKHNHNVPAPRNSSHINSSISNTLPAQASVVQSHLHRPEPLQVHNSMARFDGSSAFGSFGPPGRLQLGPTHGFGFGMNQPGLLNWAMAGLNPNQGKLPIMPPYHPYLGQSRPINEMGFMLPKEPKVESISEPGLNVPNGRLPLGPRM